MKRVVIIDGGPRKNFNTASMLQKFAEGVMSVSDQIEVKTVRLYGLNYKGCMSCMSCKIKDKASKAGLEPGINVSSKLDGSAGNYHASVNIDDVVNTFDLALPLGISYDFGGLVLDARYTLGLTKTFKDNYLDSKNITFQIGIGYKFNL